MSTPKFVPGSEEHDKEYTHGQTGWYIDAVSSRQQEVGKYLGCSVYCIGIYPGYAATPKKINTFFGHDATPMKMFIQPTRNVDKRTGKLEYLVVIDPVDIRAVLDILHRPYTPEEKRQAKVEREQLMEMARQGVL